VEIASREKTVTFAVAGLCVVIGILSFLAVVYFTQAINTQDRMNSQTANLQSTIDELQTEKATLENQIASLQIQINNLNNQNRNLDSQVNSMTKHVRSIEGILVEVGLCEAITWSNPLYTSSPSPLPW